MAYQENKPLATDRLKDSQSDIQGNFQSNKTSFDQNHVTFDIADTGKHKFLQMPEQGAAPTTAANEMALYTKQSGNVAQMFIRRESDGSELNITQNEIDTSVFAPAQIGRTTGYTRLASGLLVKWGYVIGGAGGRDASQVHTFPTSATIPVFSDVYYSGVTSTNNVAGVSQPLSGVGFGGSKVFVVLISVDATTITVAQIGTTGASGGAHDFTYYVIGV